MANGYKQEFIKEETLITDAFTRSGTSLIIRKI